MSQHKRNNIIRWTIILALLLIVYIVSYLALSLQGRYEPGAIGTSGVKWYEWAPSGFVTDHKWNRLLICPYYPLYLFDCRYWHTENEADGNKYPVNKVLRNSAISNGQ
jgi:hypothetical protein